VALLPNRVRLLTYSHVGSAPSAARRLATIRYISVLVRSTVSGTLRLALTRGSSVRFGSAPCAVRRASCVTLARGPGPEARGFLDDRHPRSGLALVGIAAAFGLLLGWAAVRYRVQGDPVVDQIDAILPQTQCGQCSYAGCRPYAEAIVAGEADINQCPPGGEDGVRALADLLDREPKPLNPENGVEKETRVAFIIESLCIGCTKCIQACPVDAIVGAPKLMHTVITDECTGCDLCLPPCPVDCIDMVLPEAGVSAWRWPQPAPDAHQRSVGSTTEAEAG
jgi:electron transport complex protein RnfB